MTVEIENKGICGCGLEAFVENGLLGSLQGGVPAAQFAVGVFMLMPEGIFHEVVKVGCDVDGQVQARQYVVRGSGIVELGRVSVFVDGLYLFFGEDGVVKDGQILGYAGHVLVIGEWVAVFGGPALGDGCFGGQNLAVDIGAEKRGTFPVCYAL